jgi:hypothetical protein
MAIATNTSLTFSSVKIREEVSDVIYNIAPMDTPFLSGCSKTSVDNVYFQWQTDTIGAGAANRKIEGDDNIAANARVNPVLLGNRTQISQYVNQTSGTDQVMDYAGHGRNQAYQIAKNGKRMKRDMEFMLTNNVAQVAGDATTARVSAGIPSWLASNFTDGGTGGGSAGSLGTTAMTNSGGRAAVTEDNIKVVIKQCYDSGGSPDLILCPSNVKQAISGLSSNVGPGYPLRVAASTSGQATAVNAVDVYVSDFGTFRIVPDRNLATDGPGSNAGNVFFLDMDYWSVAWLRPFQTVDLAKTGDSIKQLLLAEFGLISKNEKSSGILASVQA